MDDKNASNGWDPQGALRTDDPLPADQPTPPAAPLTITDGLGRVRTVAEVAHVVELAARVSKLEKLVGLLASGLSLTQGDVREIRVDDK